MKPETFLCLMFISATRATIPSWQALPECLRNIGQDLTEDLNSFDKCDSTSSGLEEASLPGYLAKVDQAEKNLELIRQLLDQPSRDVFVGFTGATGSVGRRGDTGFTGPTGSTGSPGVLGAYGAVGVPGVIGPKGPPGPPGNTGPSAK